LELYKTAEFNTRLSQGNQLECEGRPENIMGHECN